jgi:hypothetical protein
LNIKTNNLNKELEEQAAKLFYWNGLAMEARREMTLYEMLNVEQYMAHARRFAKLYLKAMNEKDTVESRNDAVVLVFSRDIGPSRRHEYAELCFSASMCSGESETLKKDAPAKWDDLFKKFYADMYKDVLKDIPVTYDDLQTRLADLRQRRDLMDSLSECFKQRGICLTSIASNARATNDVDAIRIMDKARTAIEGARQ